MEKTLCAVLILVFIVGGHWFASRQSVLDGKDTRGEEEIHAVGCAMCEQREEEIYAVGCVMCIIHGAADMLIPPAWLGRLPCCLRWEERSIFVGKTG
jgi:hypothetical protein